MKGNPPPDALKSPEGDPPPDLKLLLFFFFGSSHLSFFAEASSASPKTGTLPIALHGTGPGCLAGEGGFSVDIEYRDKYLFEMTPNEAGVADGFVCPITCLTMVDPVMLTGDGHTYERYAIEQWLRRGNRTSPLAGSDLGSNVQLVPNHAVRKAIAELKVELPSKSDIEEACGHKAADILDKDEPGPSKTARVYNEDETYIFASLRRSLYSLDATVCVWKAKQLCLSKANSCTSVDSTWPNTMKAQITCMKACGRSRAIVSGSRDNILRVWELPSSVEETASPAHLREVAALQCHSDWINCLDVNCAEEVVVTGGRDSRIRVWDTLKWTCNHTLRTDDYVNCLAFDRVKDGFFVSGGNDWKLVSGKRSSFPSVLLLTLQSLFVSLFYSLSGTQKQCSNPMSSLDTHMQSSAAQ